MIHLGTKEKDLEIIIFDSSIRIILNKPSSIDTLITYFINMKL